MICYDALNDCKMLQAVMNRNLGALNIFIRMAFPD